MYKYITSILSLSPSPSLSLLIPPSSLPPNVVISQ